MRTFRRQRSEDAFDAADLVPVYEARRWQKVAQAVVVVVLVIATAGVLGIVVRTSVLLGRMTTEVSIAQQRTTNLHQLQFSALELSLALVELHTDGNTDAVTIRRGLFGRLATVVRMLFPPSSSQAQQLQEIQTELDRFPWDRLEGKDHGRTVALGAAETLVLQVGVQVKAMYDGQEKFFYDATRESLRAKRSSQNALVVLVSLVVVMAVCLLILLRRRARNRLVLAYAALLSEVTERRTLQVQLSHQAFHDALTGLPNRVLFLQQLTATMRSAADSANGPSVVLIDLDGFKNVNDTLGHAAGDDLLQRIADRLRGCVRAGDTVARLGGDEFAIVVPADAGHEALAVSRRLIDALTSPIMVAGQEISISASIGIAHLDGQGSADDLLSDADIAMYAAKKAGKDRYETFRHDMRDQTLQRVRLEQQLARAVANREIDVFYQPIVNLRTDRVTAVEALARWRHPEDGIVSPAVFVPVAEDCGLIREIGRVVLREACVTVQQWRETVPGSEDLSVTVNVSARQLDSGTFSGQLFDALRDSGLPPANLTLEITESLMLEESDSVVAELARIKSLGVRLAMDDFGAGYSSIALLLRLQVDVLKIDKTFLDLDSREQGTLIRAITELGHTLGLTVVAEGVETSEQLAHIRAAQCDAAQGFLLSGPMPEAAARRHLEGAQRARATSTAVPGTGRP